MPTVSEPIYMYDFALVTPLGILYQHVYYTCSRAIRERWFEMAQIDGGWNIRIRYTPTEMRFIFIFTDSEDVEECRVVVREPLQGFELENYLQSVQLMKLAKQILKDND
jgi:hypothetical protein